MRFFPKRRRPVFQAEPEGPVSLHCAEPGCDQQIEYEPERSRLRWLQRPYEEWGGAGPEVKVVYLRCRNGHNRRYEVRINGTADA